MKVDRFIRASLAFLILLVFVIAIAALFFVTESALNVWDRLREGPLVVLWGFLGLLAAIAGTALWRQARSPSTAGAAVAIAPYGSRCTAKPRICGTLEDELPLNFSPELSACQSFSWWPPSAEKVKGPMRSAAAAWNEGSKPLKVGRSTEMSKLMPAATYMAVFRSGR
ncbi:MAG: hypothetical protein R3176_05030, partial [Woeseiaceae bacterium]|nr:hypothetical protein [Woeseiaceae bacterium]